MIHQILVIDDVGFNLIDRTYGQNTLDPFLVSGFLSAVLPRMEEFGFDLNSLAAELTEKEGTYLEISRFSKGYVVVIAEDKGNRNKIKDICKTLNTIIENHLESFVHAAEIDLTDLDQLQTKMDEIVSQEGVAISIDPEKDPILPILKQVYDKKIKPKDAAKKILKWIEQKKLDTQGLEMMKKTLMIIDQMLPQTKGSKMDPLQTTIKATYKGVSQLIVRMDKAMMF
ncbi:MAG: hypothetical protein D6732_19235 [Methanobacteriota archaeon]|nr:MAG: hypothetical protein D6732_19235 [Euryarchaeota archaeon]